jgi:hypothetical protein
LSATVRPDHDGKARTLLAWPGESGTVAWHHAPDETRKRLEQAFPGLNAGQISRACLAVDGICRRAQAGRPHTGASGAWSAKSWPSRDYADLPPQRT